LSTPWQLDDRFVLDKELIPSPSPSPSPEALEDPLNLSLGSKDLLRIRNALTISLASASPVSLEIPHENGNKILMQNPGLKGKIELRLQNNSKDFFMEFCRKMSK